jgi:CrcB protein
MAKLTWIAIGGACGALARYGLSLAVQRAAGGVFPWGTACVNLLGSLLIGVLAAAADERIVPEPFRALLMIGLLGALTTFSTFSFDALRLIQDRQYALAAGYVAGSVVAGLALATAGFLAARAILNPSS